MVILPADWTRSEISWSGKGHGLGYVDEAGELTHHLWMDPKDSEFGPYSVRWLAYETDEQLLELLSLLRQLGDQLHQITMLEPAELQMQDLLHMPFRRMRQTRQSKFEQKMWLLAYWQIRICDLAACVQAISVPHGGARFNLVLSDPIEPLLDPDSTWRGVAGTSIVTFGAESSAVPGEDAALPTMRASVNAFSRLWLGAASATSLALTDDLDAPAELLSTLDDLLRFPEPHVDWDY